MEMIVSGAPQELDFIVRICRDKVRRGLIKFSLATNPANENGDSKYVEPSDSKDVVMNDKKTTKRSSKKSE